MRILVHKISFSELIKFRRVVKWDMAFEYIG